MNEVELKGVVNDLVEKIAALIKIKVKKKDVDQTINKFYQMGYDDIEVKFNINIAQDSKELAFLKDYTFNN